MFKRKGVALKRNVKKTHLKIFRAKCKESAPLGTWLGGKGSIFKSSNIVVFLVQLLEIPLFQMDAISVNYWLTKFVPLKERYPPKT